jgi:hypothetical protein
MKRILSLSLAAGLCLLGLAAEAACPTRMTGPIDPGNMLNTFNNNNQALMSAGACPAGGFTVSPRNWNTCGFVADPATSAVTDQTPVATEVYIAEVFVPAAARITGVALYNGSVASGNVKVGLANSSGAVLATSASTAMSGTTVYQRVPFVTGYDAVGPATYYVLSFVDNNTARMGALTVGNCGAAKQTGQTYATGFTTVTPPTTFTTALGPVAGLY